MTKTKKELNFVLASDENYTDKLAVTMYSILEVHKECEKVYIHVLSNNISGESINQIKLVGNKFKNSELLVYNLNNLAELLGKEVNVDHLSLAAYARLFIPNLLSNEIDIALYMDVDVLVNNSLFDLFNLDISDNLVGGVKSLIDLSVSKDKNFHINSGVVLWNLKKCREENFVEKSIEYIGNSRGKIKFHDQTIINDVCKGKIVAIQPKYNVMSNMFFLNYSKFTAVYGLDNYYNKELYENAVNTPSIIHLTSWVVGRPWESNCIHPYKNEYRRILRETPWKDIPLIDNSNKEIFNKVKRAFYIVIPGTSIKYLTKMKRVIKSTIRGK